MHIDGMVGEANWKPSSSSGTYWREIRGKNIIEEIIPLKAKSYLPRSVSNHICHHNNQGSFLQSSGSPVIYGGLANGMPHGLVLPVSSWQPVKEESIGNDSGWASDFNPTEFHYGMDAKMDAKKVSVCGANVNNHRDLQNSHVNLGEDCCEVSTGKELVLYGEGGSQSEMLSAANRNNDIDQGRELIPYNGGSQNKFVSTANWINSQNHTVTAPDSFREGTNSFQRPTVTVPVPRLTPRKRAATRSPISDRLSRARKTENLKAMRELLPHSRKGTILAVLEETTDYIKYLQLQIKILTQSRLGGEPTFDPFIHLEGFGHYLLHDHMLNEPLEMALGRMIEGNMSAVTQLLETKGLYLMPLPLEGSSKPGP